MVHVLLEPAPGGRPCSLLTEPICKSAGCSRASGRSPSKPCAHRRLSAESGSHAGAPALAGTHERCRHRGKALASVLLQFCGSGAAARTGKRGEAKLSCAAKLVILALGSLWLKQERGQQVTGSGCPAFPQRLAFSLPSRGRAKPTRAPARGSQPSPCVLLRPTLPLCPSVPP